MGHGRVKGCIIMGMIMSTTMTMGTRMGHIIITAAIDDTTSVDCWALNECGYPTTEKTEQFAEIIVT